MDVNIPLDVKTYIDNNPTKFKNLPITLRNIEKFMESYKSPSSLDIENLHLFKSFKKLCEFKVVVSPL